MSLPFMCFSQSRYSEVHCIVLCASLFIWLYVHVLLILLKHLGHGRCLPNISEIADCRASLDLVLLLNDILSSNQGSGEVCHVKFANY